jgi:transcription elongation GreA/GreB family factor
MNPLAPIGQLLKGKKEGDCFEFNGKNTYIISVW